MKKTAVIVFLGMSLLANTLCQAADTGKVLLESSDKKSFRLRTGEYTLSYDPESRADKKGWVMIRRDGKANGLATKLANGNHLDVTDLGAGEGAAYNWAIQRKDFAIFRSLHVEETNEVIRIHIKSERRWAKFHSTLTVYKEHPGLIHWRVDAKALHDQTFSNSPKSDCFFTIGDSVDAWGGVQRSAVRYHVQRGPTAGTLYFRDIDMDSFVFISKTCPR